MVTLRWYGGEPRQVELASGTAVWYHAGLVLRHRRMVPLRWVLLRDPGGELDSQALPTFVDALALVRQQLWPVGVSYLSPPQPDLITIPRTQFNRLTDTLAYAA